MRPPLLVKLLLNQLVWQMPVNDKNVYLTFDDGPIPEVTPWVLDQLRRYNAKATFFCVGDNVKKHPEVYTQILKEGHRTGNHTMNHINGWTNFNRDYFRNIEECSRYVKSDLFRPPYGKIRPTQIRKIGKEYKIIMWDVLTHDYDPKESGEDCFRRVRKNVRPGSVIVFHDSLKAEKNLRYALPATLELLSKENYRFLSIQ